MLECHSRCPMGACCWNARDMNYTLQLRFTPHLGEIHLESASFCISTKNLICQSTVSVCVHGVFGLCRRQLSVIGSCRIDGYEPLFLCPSSERPKPVVLEGQWTQGHDVDDLQEEVGVPAVMGQLRDCVVGEQRTIYKCPVGGCRRTFLDTEEVEEHRRESHNWLCDTCGLVVLYKRTLVRHKRRHNPFREPEVLCDVCKKGFVSRGNLRAHQRLKHAD